MKMECIYIYRAFGSLKWSRMSQVRQYQTESFGYFKKLRKLDKGDLRGELIMRW